MLDWVDTGPEDPKGAPPPLVIVLCGITSSSSNGYIVEVVKWLKKHGFGIVVYHNRGINGSKLKLPEEEGVFTNMILDFAHTVRQIKEKHPRRKIYAVGHSFGGHLLCNYLGGYPGTAPCLIDGAVGMAPPTDMLAVALHVNSSWLGGLLAGVQNAAMIIPNRGMFESQAAERLGLSYEKCLSAKNGMELNELVDRRI